MKNYETEARSRWGNTDAYREYKEKTKSYIEEKWDAVNVGMMAIFAEFFCVQRKWRKCRFCRGAGACCQASGAHHGELLHLHRRDPRGAWQDVRCRREVQEEH